MIKKESYNKYFQEAIIFMAIFILTILHEWMLINNVESFIKALILFVLLYLQAQMNLAYIFPLFLEKKYFLYSLLTIIITLAGSSILLLINYFWIDPTYYQKENILTSLLYQFVICLISTFTIMALSLMREYSQEIQLRNKNQLLFNDINIKFLSAQLNPHFFFNMLNNLYGVSLTQSERVPDLILKLSDLMRYQIESVNKTIVPLHEELKFIKNYIDLEKERIGKRCKITFEAPFDSELIEHYNIAPLLLINLIENAFKHSLSSKNWYVFISISIIDHDTLYVKLQNSLSHRVSKNNSTGIGLKNISQRLDFLYKGKYNIWSSKNENCYQTKLLLNLKKQ